MIFDAYIFYRVFEIIPLFLTRFIIFYFQLVEKFEYAWIFQLIESNFQFVENVNFFVITLCNLLISRIRI